MNAKQALLRRLPLREAIQAFCPSAVPSLCTATEVVSAPGVASSDIDISRKERPGWPFVVCEYQTSENVETGLVSVFADDVLRVDCRPLNFARSFTYPLIARRRIRISSTAGNTAATVAASATFSGFHVPPHFASVLSRVRGNAWVRMIGVSATEPRSIVTEHDSEIAAFVISGTSAPATALASQLLVNVDGETLFPAQGPRTQSDASQFGQANPPSRRGTIRGPNLGLRMSPFSVPAGRTIEVGPLTLTPQTTQTVVIIVSGGTFDALPGQA